MNIIKPRVLVPQDQLDPGMLTRLERCARICYKSEEKMVTGKSGFLASVIARGHESVIEHEKITVLMITDRGVTHEFVRHRVGSYSQESTRYCNYGQNRFGREITVIEPYFYRDTTRYEIWKEGCLAAERAYFALLESGSTPQEARSVLPNSLKTELAVTYNIRQWRHFLTLRCDVSAHPQARQMAIPLLLLFQERLPVLFGDIAYDRTFPVGEGAEIVLTDELFVARGDS